MAQQPFTAIHSTEVTWADRLKLSLGESSDFRTGQQHHEILAAEASLRTSPYAQEEFAIQALHTTNSGMVPVKLIPSSIGSKNPISPRSMVPMSPRSTLRRHLPGSELFLPAESPQSVHSCETRFLVVETSCPKAGRGSPSRLRSSVSWDTSHQPQSPLRPLSSLPPSLGLPRSLPQTPNMSASPVSRVRPTPSHSMSSNPGESKKSAAGVSSTFSIHDNTPRPAHRQADHKKPSGAAGVRAVMAQREDIEAGNSHAATSCSQKENTAPMKQHKSRRGGVRGGGGGLFQKISKAFVPEDNAKHVQQKHSYLFLQKPNLIEDQGMQRKVRLAYFFSRFVNTCRRQKRSELYVFVCVCVCECVCAYVCVCM